ncbi:hypothetical protein CQA42_00850 [Helicobacter sp. MIT 99-5507]|nr:hypothetical protein CQA42_00850 [Helicobacter sp. MIT 99-5507]
MIYQATYIGLSKSLEFLNICNKIFKDKGIKLPLKSQQKITTKNHKSTKTRKGLRNSAHTFWRCYRQR